MRHILPLDNTKALQINPNLGIILTTDMKGWFLERYVNVFMNGAIIDFVDNVNYSGIILPQRIYSFHEVQSEDVIQIIEREIDNNNYLHIWVDEINLPCSKWFRKHHFVHPMMVYGYDNDVIKAVFFDILKGQILVDIKHQDIKESTSNLNKYYLHGGNDLAITQTISACQLAKCLKGAFHIDVFARQLSNYICCKNESVTEWYTLSRPGVFDSNTNIFGVQIYLQLIKFLESSDTRENIRYKALHDFVLHKKTMLDRLKYVQENYDTPQEYDSLVNIFADNCKALESMRLLNLKMQVKQGCFPAALCYLPEYIYTLIDTLRECYNTEITILPRIYYCLMSLTYPKDYYHRHKIIRLTKSEGISYNDYIEFDISKYNLYLSRMDIVRDDHYHASCTMAPLEFVMINNEKKYYIEKDTIEHIPFRTITFPTMKVDTIRIYTNIQEFFYTVNLYPIFHKTLCESFSVGFDDTWSGYHHLKRIDSLDNSRCVLLLTGEDPFMIKEQIGFSADNLPFFHIRMSTTVNTIYAQIFFTTVENPSISMDKSLFFKIIPDGKNHSYYLNMSRHSQWSGIVQTIRFDPAQYHDKYVWNMGEESVCDIECMEFLKEKPDDVDECMTTVNLTDDGVTLS